MKPPAAKRKSTPASRAKVTAVQKKNDMATVMFNSVMGGRSALKVCV